MGVHWKDWCWSWNSNTLATWCEELTHWKRPWRGEGLGAGGEGDDRGWDGWMASPTQWTEVWVDSGSWWWTGRPGVLWFMGSQRVRHDWVTELNWNAQEIFVAWMDHNGEERNPCSLSTYYVGFYAEMFMSVTLLRGDTPASLGVRKWWSQNTKPGICRSTPWSLPWPEIIFNVQWFLFSHALCGLFLRPLKLAGWVMTSPCCWLVSFCAALVSRGIGSDDTLFSTVNILCCWFSV